MLVIYNGEEFPKSGPVIFLAGPTPRTPDVPSWRPEALALLEKAGYTGAVIVPEDRGFENKADFDYAGQIEWERKGLERANCVLFWIPRDLADMPGFTTNIEFGFVSERCQTYVLGYPPEAPKMKYLAHVAHKQNRAVVHDLKDAVAKAAELAPKSHNAIKPPRMFL